MLAVRGADPLPFRLDLDTPVQPTLTGQDAADFATLGSADGEMFYLPAGFVQRVADHGSEMLWWLLACHSDRIGYAVRATEGVNFLNTVLADADARGRVWTRVRDALTTTRKYRKTGEDTWTRMAADAAASEKCLSRPEERASGLVPWVEACTSASQVEVLLGSFRSTAVHAIVARHARCLSPDQVAGLRTS